VNLIIVLIALFGLAAMLVALLKFVGFWGTLIVLAVMYFGTRRG
jgi:hypothetical protein